MAYFGNLTNTAIGVGIPADTKSASRYQASSTFTATMMGALVACMTGDQIRLGIYADSSGEPGALLGYTGEITPATVRTWRVAELVSGVSITSGEYYWLAIICEASITVSYSSGSYRTNSDTYSDGFADPFGSTSSDTTGMCLFAGNEAPFVIDADLSLGGAVLEASDGIKLAVVRLSVSSGVAMISDIDQGMPVIQATVTGYDACGGGVIGYVHAAIDSNDDIHIVVANLTDQTRDIAYCKAARSGNSWSFGTWEQAASYTQQAPSNPGCSISIDSSGYPHVLYVDNVKVGGSSQDNVYHTWHNGTSWQTPDQVGVRTTKTDAYYSPALTMRNSDYIECWYHSVISTHKAAWRAYTGSWGSETVYTNAAFHIYGHSVLSDTSGNVYRINANYVSAYEVYENDTDTGYDAHVGYHAASACYIDSTRYIFYIDTSTDVHVISNSGSGWTDEDAQQTGTYVYALAEWAYNNENQSGEINYIIEDDTNHIYFDVFSLGAAAQNITGAGAIASSEAFGSPTVYREQFITGAGNIASAETFGTAEVTVVGGVQNITNAGAISSAETFGTAQLNINITTAGNIGTVEAFGTAQLDLNITAAGNITTTEAFGTAQLDLNITAAGAIASGEAFGSSTVYEEQFISGAGAIASVEAFGTAQLDLNVTSAGNIASAEAFGTAQLSLNVTTTGITSVEAFGSPTLVLNITAVGDIASAEAFGNANVSVGGGTQNITNAGAIASVEAFGTAQLDLNLATVGINSVEAFGTVQLDLNITGAGVITSAEVFGIPKVYEEQFVTSAGAITSAETFGTTQLTLNITAAGGIVSAEVFGTPALEYDQDITDVGNIASAEIFGNTTVSTGAAPQNITNAGAIASVEAFGTVQLDLNITGAGGIVSAEACGSPQLDLNITSVGGIASLEALGTPQVDLNIVGVGDIVSAEAFGTAQLSLYVVAAGGIASGELFGGPLLSIGIDVAGILSVEAFGAPDLSLNIIGAGAITSAELFGTSLLRGVIRPDSDISLGNWTDQDGNTSNLYDTINEKYANDADYVKSDVTSVASTLEVGLSNVNDPGIHTNHTVYYRYKKVDNQSITAQLKVTLLQGSTTIASWTHPDVGTAWADAEQTLTEGQAANISNYNDLRLEFEVIEV